MSLHDSNAGGKCDCEPCESAKLRDNALKLADMARDLLSESLWYEKGHPGQSCRRTGWMTETWLAAERQRFREINADLLEFRS